MGYQWNVQHSLARDLDNLAMIENDDFYGYKTLASTGSLLNTALYHRAVKVTCAGATAKTPCPDITMIQSAAGLFVRTGLEAMCSPPVAGSSMIIGLHMCSS